MPTMQNNPSGQLLEMCDKQFLIDCGEGTQNTMRQLACKTARLYNIFISHLHGDHCFGLIGLLSTWGMMNRTQDVHIYAHSDLERLLSPLIAYHCQGMSYQVIFHAIDPKKHAVIYEDRTLTVTSLPLRHSVPTCGFLFEEKRKERHIIKEAIDTYQIPLAAIPDIKAGGDFITSDGRVIHNAELTVEAKEPFRYAYCSDTGYKPAIVPWIQGVDVLYHESTYTDEHKDAAERFQHSTARQAAKIAKKANAGQLLIGHFSARVIDQHIFLKEAKEEFDNVTLCRDKTTYTFS